MVEQQAKFVALLGVMAKLTGFNFDETTMQIYCVVLEDQDFAKL